MEKIKKGYFVTVRGGAKIYIIGDEFIIGKSRTADCELAGNPSISRKHAKVMYKKGGFYIQDLGSLNHTYVNGQMIQEPTLMFDGDLIKLADEEMVFHMETEYVAPANTPKKDMETSRSDGMKLSEDPFALLGKAYYRKYKSNPDPEFAAIIRMIERQ